MGNIRQRVKNSLGIMGMFGLLLGVVCVPLLCMEYRNSHMRNEIVTAPVQVVSLGDTGGAVENENIWERLELIGQSDIAVVSAYEDFRTGSLTDKRNLKAALIADAEEQLMQLAQYHVLPDVSFGDVLQVFVYKETYMDQLFYREYLETRNSEPTVSVWRIYAEYPDYYLHVYMDTETLALYDITIIAKERDIVYPAGVSTNGFLDYLKTFSDIPVEREFLFAENGHYAARRIDIHLSAINMETEEMIERFFSPVLDYEEYVTFYDESGRALSAAASQTW